MRHQLHMSGSIREYVIERHDFYVSEIKRRVLANFADVGSEARRAGEEEYARLMHLPVSGDPEREPPDLAEIANDLAQNHYMLLDGMREQTLLGALAGCFHQWDKELREFVDRELMHTVRSGKREKITWHQDWNVVFNVLKEFGWDPRASSSFAFLDAGRLVVNVYKHGKGPSLTKLAEKYPQYIHHPLATFGVSLPDEHLKHDWVLISEAEFEEIATKGMRQFWLDFPELMFAD
jgi:hypothetical protein